MVVSIGSLESLLTNEEWVALIRHIGRGDKTALAVLYDATGPLVFGLVLMIVGDRITAEQITLDVYTAAWKTASTYDEGHGTPLTWLLSIARSKAMATFNSQAHSSSHRLKIEDGYSAADLTILDDNTGRLSPEHFENAGLALETMPAEEREVLEIAYYEGLSAGEIAGRLGRPPEEVKVQITKAMTNLLRPIVSGKRANA
ncbi:MAG TPA: sigma-70 family RNA polymerase sigma factor [Blastocatellia bacterium]|nr:sigma-70 family RNA polymerase sigma factor [Blastocatellia bacterium]